MVPSEEIYFFEVTLDETAAPRSVNRCDGYEIMMKLGPITKHGSFLFGLVMFLLLLALNFAVLRLVLLLFLGSSDLVHLVFSLKAVFCGLINYGPHVADDFGDLGYFGGGVVRFNAVVDFSSVKEKCR